MEKNDLNNYQILVRARKMIEQRIQSLDKEIERTYQFIGDLVIRDKNHPTDMSSTVIMAIEDAQKTVANAKKDTSLLIWVLGLLTRKK